jgi:ubiquinone/menaquinone biosynthesis C-methylase UbiE
MFPLLQVNKNKTGWSLSSLDCVSQQFISRGGETFLDIGCGTGPATEDALPYYKKVISLDPFYDHLAFQQEKVNFSKRHVSLCAKLPHLPLKDESIDNAYISRVLHFLTPENLLPALQNILRALKKTGKAFVLSDTVYRKYLSSFLPIYEARKKQGSPCPGLIEKPERYWGENSQYLPSFINMIDKETFEKQIKSISGVIKECNYLNLDVDKENTLPGQPNFFYMIFERG